jgi:hypothetical protein
LPRAEFNEKDFQRELFWQRRRALDAMDFLATNVHTTSYLRFSESWMSFEQLHCTASQMQVQGKT